MQTHLCLLHAYYIDGQYDIYYTLYKHIENLHLQYTTYYDTVKSDSESEILIPSKSAYSNLQVPVELLLYNGIYYNKQCLYIQAIDSIQNSLDLSYTPYISNIRLYYLSVLAYNVGDYIMSIKFINECIEIKKMLYGHNSDHPDIYEALGFKARIYTILGMYMYSICEYVSVCYKVCDIKYFCMCIIYV